MSAFPGGPKGHLAVGHADDEYVVEAVNAVDFGEQLVHDGVRGAGAGATRGRWGDGAMGRWGGGGQDGAMG